MGLWFIIWLCYGQPAVHSWNGWFISALVCIVLDCLDGGVRYSR